MDKTTSHSTKPASWQVAGYPAKAEIQRDIHFAKRKKPLYCPAARFFNLLDSRLMKQLAIRLSCQITTAKSLVICGSDKTV
jgi:hypothetical protein